MDYFDSSGLVTGPASKKKRTKGRNKQLLYVHKSMYIYTHRSMHTQKHAHVHTYKHVHVHTLACKCTQVFTKQAENELLILYIITYSEEILNKAMVRAKSQVSIYFLTILK